MYKRLFILGSINTDLVITAPYMPAKGETLIGGGFFTAHGGKGANQAVAAARSGAEVLMCGAVGDDDFGKFVTINISDGTYYKKNIKIRGEFNKAGYYEHVLIYKQLRN